MNSGMAKTCLNCVHCSTWVKDGRLFYYCAARKSKTKRADFLRVRWSTPICALYAEVKVK